MKRRSLVPAMVGAAGAAAVVVAVLATMPAAPFSWFRAADAPRDWPAARLPDGAVLRYPPSMSPARADAGARSADRRGAGGLYVAYLNATPSGAPVVTRGWSAERLDRLSDENTGVTEDAAATGLRFAGGATGSCVSDHYTTRVGRHRYAEIACLVEAPDHTAVVVVAAASASSWPGSSGELRRALEAFRA